MLLLPRSLTLARLNPDMTFVYVSGAGTDSSERGRSMWARVKGQTENSLLRYWSLRERFLRYRRLVLAYRKG